MLVSKKLINKIALLYAIVVVIIIAWGSLTPDIALSQQVESRLSNLEIDINSLESRLNRIESQLGQLRGVKLPRTPASPGDRRLNQTQGSREQMFDRLATLVVELKQQVNKLETRVSKLEKK